MKNSFKEDSNNPVFNDYEESITFDKDDPDFKPNHNCNTNIGKFT